MDEAMTTVARFYGADCVYLVSDNSMIGSRIFKNDAVFVSLQETAENGDIALACCNGEVRIGKYSRNGSIEALTPSNCKYTAIISDTNNPTFEIFGKVVAFISRIDYTKYEKPATAKE